MPYSRAVKFCFYSFTLAQIISIFGDRLHQFSVVGMIGKIAPGSSVELFQFALFAYLPILVFAPLFGSLIDRTNKVLVLIVVDIVRGAVVLAIPTLFYLIDSLYAFYLSVFVLSLANLWFAPAKSAVIPEIFGERHLLQINAVLWGLGIVGTLGGFVVGGWLFDYHTWELSFYSDGASYLISVLFLLPLLFMPARRPADIPNGRAAAGQPPRRFQTRGIVASIRDGLELIRGSRTVAVCLVAQTSLFACLGILYVTGIARVQEILPSDKTIYLSAVASAGTTGLLAGSALATFARRWVSIQRLIAHSTFLFALACFGLARAESVAPIVAWAFVMGLAVSPISIVTEAVLQATIPEAFRGRVFSTREVLTRTAFLLTSSLATMAGAVASKGMILLVVGVFLALLGVLLERKNFLEV